MSSSGLVFPSAASVRADHVTGSENALLDAPFASPLPLASGPSQTTSAVRSMATGSLLRS